MRRCWVLDVEGTLLRLPVAIETVREELHALAAGRGDERRFTPLLPAIAECARRLGPDFFAEAYALIERHELAAAPAASVCEGARELLAAAATRGEPVLLVSNSSEAALRAAFQVCGLDPRERALVGRRPGLPPKPDPAPLLEALSALPEPPELVLAVGDRVPDALMARAAAPVLAARGVALSAIGIASDERAREKLLAAGTGRVIASLLELVAL